MTASPPSPPSPRLPLAIMGEGDDLADRVRAERAALRELLRAHGALLFRGFDVGGVDGFETVVRALSGPPLAYAERSSPRTAIKGDIYTSTDHPAQEEIFLHNENSYQAVWPLVLYFHCVEPPLTLGATPLADTRAVLARIDPSVLQEFAGRGWMLVRNHHEELGMSWRQAFGTDDRDEVERYCARNGIRTRWGPSGGLRTIAVRKAVHRHPVTATPVWFNHIAIFHVTTLPEPARLGLLEMYGEENLPSNTYYGDGGRIPDEVMDHLRDCYRTVRVRFDYHRDDLLVVDNMLTSHGREPFTGPRRVAVAMAEPYSG